MVIQFHATVTYVSADIIHVFDTIIIEFQLLSCEKEALNVVGNIFNEACLQCENKFVGSRAIVENSITELKFKCYPALMDEQAEYIELVPVGHPPFLCLQEDKLRVGINMNACKIPIKL